MKKCLFLLITVFVFNSTFGQIIRQSFFDNIREGNVSIGMHQTVLNYDGKFSNVIVPYASALLCYKGHYQESLSIANKEAIDRFGIYNIKNNLSSVALILINSAEMEYVKDKYLDKLNITQESIQKLKNDIETKLYSEICEAFLQVETNKMFQGIYWSKERYMDLNGSEAVYYYAEALTHSKHWIESARNYDSALKFVIKAKESFNSDNYPSDFCFKESNIDTLYKSIQSILQKNDLKNVYGYYKNSKYVNKEEAFEFIKKYPEANINDEIIKSLYEDIIYSVNTPLFRRFLDSLPFNVYSVEILTNYLLLSKDEAYYNKFTTKYPHIKTDEKLQNALNQSLNARILLFYNYKFGEKVPQNEYIFYITSSDFSYSVSLSINSENTTFGEGNKEFTRNYYLQLDEKEVYPVLSSQQMDRIKFQTQIITNNINDLIAKIRDEINYPFDNIKLNTKYLTTILQQNDSTRFLRTFNKEFDIISETKTKYNLKGQIVHKRNIVNEGYKEQVYEEKYRYLNDSVANILYYVNGEIKGKFQFLINNQGQIISRYSYNEYDGSLKLTNEYKYDSLGRVYSEKEYDDGIIIKYNREYVKNSKFLYITTLFYSIDNGKTFTEHGKDADYTTIFNKNDNCDERIFMDKSNNPIMSVETYYLNNIK